jgi:aspartate/tyrosine/aromatic aminotransferase
MFASLGLTPRQCVQAREDFHLHMSGSGRINVAGLTTANLDHAAEALIRLESLQTAG